MAKRRYRTKKRNKQRSHLTKKRRNNKRRTKRRTKSKRMKGGMERLRGILSGNPPEETGTLVGVSRDWVPPADDAEEAEAARLEAEAAERDWDPEIMEQQRGELEEIISRLRQEITTLRDDQDAGGDKGTIKMKIELKNKEIKDAESELVILNKKIIEVQDEQSEGCSIM